MRGATTLLSIAVAVIPAFAGDVPGVREYEERCVARPLDFEEHLLIGRCRSPASPPGGASPVPDGYEPPLWSLLEWHPFGISRSLLFHRGACI